jgi:3-hydroxyacyl-CoA dehydrogenase
VKEEGRFPKTLLWNSLFNPAHLKLFEIIPGPQTSSEVLDFLQYMERNFWERLRLLLKILQRLLETVLGFTESKFVPLVKEMGLTIEE